MLSYKLPTSSLQTLPLTLLQSLSLALKGFRSQSKTVLHFYNSGFVLHQLHCELFGETSVGVYFHALLIHCPVWHELVCSRRVRKESSKVSAKCTDRKPENMLC